MSFGWVGKILHINLSTGEITKKNTLPYVKKYIGGRMLAARLAWEYIPIKASSFDAENVIIVATGPLSGTIAPSSGRTIMSMISPVPFPFPWYTHSTIGGWFAAQLKFAGFDALIIRGKSSERVYIEICDARVNIKNADDLWGKDTVETQEILKKDLGSNAQILAIGPAGENQIKFATVQHDFSCASGHSGFGAVWGSKNLKAIAVNGTGDVRVASPDKLLNECVNIGKYWINPEHKFLLYDRDNSNPALMLKNMGPICSQSCVSNCHVGKFLTTIDNRTINTFCIGRSISGKMKTEYNRLGTNIKVPPVREYEPEASVALLEMFDRLGIDYWVRPSLQTWLTALKEEGIDKLHGYCIKPDDSTWFLNLIQDVAFRRGLGELFTDGLARSIDILKEELPANLIRLGHELVFGFGFHAHREGRFWDRTPLPYWIFSAMMYLSETRDPIIGSHSLMLLAEIQFSQKEKALKKFRKLAQRVWQDPTALEPNFAFEHKAPVAIWCQRMHFLIDSLPLCDFAFPMLIKPYNNVQEWLEDEDIYGDLDLDRRLLNAITGENFTREELDRAADRAFFIEKCLLARAGRSRKHEEPLYTHFELPCRDDNTYITKDDFLKLMDVFYDYRGLDKKDGWPIKEKLLELGLEDVAQELASIRNLL